jgi:hypothetical protein
MGRFGGLASLLGLLASACAVACGPAPTTYVHTNAALGRVVVYRNGIAYFERTAHVEGDTLRLSVPADKIDDFLKSLTVVDAKTGEPTPIAYPTTPPSSPTGLIDLEIKLSGPSPHDLKLTYVTEAPSWKPSYRVVLGEGGKVGIEGWAVIDNTSGEDWRDVRLGVGSSSALSFKFDLASVRLVERDTLQSEDLFAVAPPSGGALHGTGEEKVARPIAEISDQTIAQASKDDRQFDYDGEARAGAGGGAPSSGPYKMKKPAVEPKGKKATEQAAGAMAAPAAPPPPAAAPEIEALARRVKLSGKTYVVEGYADAGEADKTTASLERATKIRAQLVTRGVPPEKIVAVGKGHVPGKAGGARVVEAAVAGKAQPDDPEAGGKDPIGTSHFESSGKMSVKRGTSAMISILKGATAGEVVYYYDAESVRGNARFPFRAIRITNPTDSTLESGPVTVFGEGKFVGEGISDPIPPRASAFVPFALDRQIVVDRTPGEREEVARIISVQRGVFSTETKHIRTTKLTFHNRLAQTAKLSIRHTVPAGYVLEPKELRVERIGNAHVLGLEIGAGAKKEVVIEESTPVFKTIDLRSPAGMELVRLYATNAAIDAGLRESIKQIVAQQKTIGNLEQRVSTTREQMNEYRARMDELHMQLVTLKAVKSAGPLMRDLEKKMQEMSDKLSKATIELVAAQEQLMMARIRMQDAIAELTLEKPSDDKTAAK